MNSCRRERSSRSAASLVLLSFRTRNRSRLLPSAPMTNQVAEKVLDSLYRVVVPLPRNPLKEVNCYVLAEDDRWLVIDTGMNRPECREVLTAGLDEIGVDLEKTDFLATHLHADHHGLIPELLRPGRTASMGAIDAASMGRAHGGWSENSPMGGVPQAQRLSARGTRRVLQAPSRRPLQRPDDRVPTAGRGRRDRDRRLSTGGHRHAGSHVRPHLALRPGQTPVHRRRPHPGRHHAQHPGLGRRPRPPWASTSTASPRSRRSTSTSACQATGVSSTTSRAAAGNSANTTRSAAGKSSTSSAGTAAATPTRPRR